MMPEMTLYYVLSCFVVYSFVGWIIEVVYQAVGKGIVVNRGFLNGPVCPIYGFGVISVLGLLGGIGEKYPEAVNAPGIFIIGVLLSTFIELVGGWILDKLFHARWWDYRDRKFNLNGYICPQFSMFWGIGVLLIVRVAHPFIRNTVITTFDTFAGHVVLASLCVLYAADVILSVFIMIGLNRRFAELDELRERMRVVSDTLSTKIGETSIEGAGRVDHMKLEAALAKAELRDELSEKRDELQHAVHGAAGEIRGAVNSAADDVRKAVQGAADGFDEAVHSAAYGIKDAAQGTQDAIFDAVHVTAEDLRFRLKETEALYEARKNAVFEKLCSGRVFGMGRMLFQNPTFTHGRDEYAKLIDELRIFRKKEK